MKYFKLLVMGLVSVTAVSAFAGAYEGEVDFLNPNSCRAFARVVDPTCDGSIALHQCEAVQQTLGSVNSQIDLDLHAECSTWHTGNLPARVLDEVLTGSASSDGYRLKVSVKTTSATILGATVQVQTQDFSSCAKAAELVEALANHGLKITAACNANELRIELPRN